MYEQRIEEIKKSWAGACNKVLGPVQTKNGFSYLIAVTEEPSDTSFYLYDADGGGRHIAAMFLELTASDIMIIHDIQMREEDCNQGLGSILMDAALAYAKGHKIKKISGHLSSVDKDHHDRAAHFYKKYGFRVSYNKETGTGRIEREC